MQNWERCEKGINASIEKLKVFKMKLSMPLPDNHEELHSEQIRCKVRTIRCFVYTDDLLLLPSIVAVRINRQHVCFRHMSDLVINVLSCLVEETNFHFFN